MSPTAPAGRGRDPLSWGLSSPAATLALGRALGGLLLPGDFVALSGDLGAGKTLLVRGAAEGAGVPPGEPVSSPTFAIAHRYGGGRVPLHHLDLYRIADEGELFALGFEEWLAEPLATLCEWPERAGGHLPDGRLELRLLRRGPRSRTVSLRPLGARAEELAAALVRSVRQSGR
jgi:tRNA threonylcarbamoyladenosine biosynthesis protein TsaE